MSLLILFDSGGTTTVSAPVNVVDINILTKRLVRIVFDDEVVVTDNYNDISNYDINAIEGSGDVRVTGVLPINTDTSLDLILITDPMRSDTRYEVSATSLQNRSGVDFGVLGEYVARVTKGDSVLRSIPMHYDKRSKSNLHQILLAMGQADDLIGGSRSEDI